MNRSFVGTAAHGLGAIRIVADFLAARDASLFHLSYGRLESWNPVKRGEFSDTLCLPERNVDAALERLAHAGFDSIIG